MFHTSNVGFSGEKRRVGNQKKSEWPGYVRVGKGPVELQCVTVESRQNSEILPLKMQVCVDTAHAAGLTVHGPFCKCAAGAVPQ